MLRFMRNGVACNTQLAASPGGRLTPVRESLQTII